MTLDVHGKQTIAWQAPPKVPAGMTCVSVTIGRDPANMGVEVAQATWSRSGTPTREAMASLHAARLAKRLCPVVVAVVRAGDEAGSGAPGEQEVGDVWLFGPLPDGQVIGPLAADHATRLLQSALDQPNGLLARHRLAALYEALGSTGLPGVANAGLFATNDLQRGARRRGDWQAATVASAKLLGLRRHGLLEALGYTLDTSGDATVLTTDTSPPRAVAVLLEEDESFDAGSARFTVSPVAYGLDAAAKHHVPWLLVTRGSQLRLYPARPHVGVGRKGQAETYFEVDLAMLTDDTAGFVTLVFSGAALAEGGSVDELLEASAQYAVALGERLRTKVYDDVVPSLSVAIAEALRDLGHDMDRAGLDLAYQLTLRTFFRILFQAYAEDRKLLPYGENPEFDRHALNTLATDFTERPDRAFDAASTSLWDGLAQMWRVIDTGDDDWSMPAYNGGLFSSDPDLHPAGALLAQISVTNDVLGPALQALLVDTDDADVTGPVDFRSLSVREFGTIYEGLLESNLALADVDLTLGKNDTWLPATEGDDVVAPAGTVYFHNTSGQRKGTGSYFTPSFVVEHLLERALDPSLDAHLERVAALLADHDTTGAARLFFDFRVADLAMGSGHFLTAAIDHIEAKMAAFLEHHPIPGVADELRRLEEAARKATGPDSPPIEPSSLLRRQVARRCIYGLDINAVAVELARVSIWIHTFVRGLPMSSLDHNLVCANSLTGIGSVDEALEALTPKKTKKGMGSVFTYPISKALEAARDTLADVAAAAEATWQDAQDAARAAQQARTDAETARLLFDAAVLRRIGRTDLASGDLPGEITEAVIQPAAQQMIAELLPAHFPFLFPEVFLREHAGFDVLVGNPPWKAPHIKEDRWWNLRFPGIITLPQKKRDSEVTRLRSERPDLYSELGSEIAKADRIRAALMAERLPGIGSGHVDVYQVFAWRNWLLLRDGGRSGVVLPRGAHSGSGLAEWRKKILLEGQYESVCFIENAAHWAFEIHPQYTLGLTVILKEPEQEVRWSGPFSDFKSFKERGTAFLEVSTNEFLSWTDNAAFPLISESRSIETFRQLKASPRFDAITEPWRLRPTRGDYLKWKKVKVTGDARITIWRGKSFNLWDPSAGPIRAEVSEPEFRAAYLDYLTRASKNKQSAHYGREYSLDDLPLDRCRIAIRWISRATDTRTCIACLIPPGSATDDSASVMHRLRGDERDEAFILGVLSSHIFDWQARLLTEMNFTFQILNQLGFPQPDRDDPRRARVIEIAGRLAAVDDRYSDWAEAVDVPVGSVTEVEKPELIAELDALVAHLYGLDRGDVTHIFETFHRGWDYQPRLTMVLKYL